ADESVEVFYCSHVLEHIEDDVQAISEIYRVLKKEGYAIIMVPIMAQKTYEDFSITDPAEREKVFGQHDHVRLYGVDFKDKLMAPGFKVSAYYFDEMFCQKEMNRLGLKYVEAAEMPIYLCEKR
ncbi:MAG: methyltransferase domain-containing protein, partial [Planctomycetota bacterium]